MYNLTGIEQANNIVGQIAGLNEISGGFLTLFVMIVLYIAIIAYYKEQDFRYALTGASVVMGLIALFAMGMHWISPNLAILPMVLAFVGIMASMFMD